MGNVFDVQIRKLSTGEFVHGGDWDPPLEIVMDLPSVAANIPDEEIVAAYYGGSPAAWQRIPYLGHPGPSQPDPTLNGLAQQDGFFVRGTGAGRQTHILTRHATPFAMFRQTKNADNGGGGADNGGGTGGGGTGGGGGTSTQTTPQPPTVPFVAPQLAKLTVTGGAAKLKAKRGRLTITCRAAAPANTCRVTIRQGKREKGKMLARGSAPLQAGKANVRVSLTAAGRKALKKARRKAVTVTLLLEARGAAGTLGSKSRTARLSGK
jgi:hypothetical protein